jgi:hypothetical protein
MRATFYFTLVRTFGDIPLALTETEGVPSGAVREPVAKVYDAIIADLKAVEAVLPDKVAQYGRADKPAAQQLLGESTSPRRRRDVLNDFARRCRAPAVATNPAFAHRTSDLWVMGKR